MLKDPRVTKRWLPFILMVAIGSPLVYVVQYGMTRALLSLLVVIALALLLGPKPTPEEVEEWMFRQRRPAAPPSRRDIDEDRPGQGRRT